MEKELEKLKKLLCGNPKYTVAYTLGSRTFYSESRGIAPLIALAENGIDLKNAYVADRIIGRAAALLYVRLGAEKLYTPVAERGAAEIFAENEITLYADETTEKIINRSGDGECPMNLAVAGIKDTDAAYAALKAAVGGETAAFCEL